MRSLIDIVDFSVEELQQLLDSPEIREDFWIADEIDWFAPGKQKPSPIVELFTAARDNGVRPILYLAAKNVMDLEKLEQKRKNFSRSNASRYFAS